MPGPKLKRMFLAATVLLLAFGLRLATIRQVPPGLSHDEAYNGVTAIQVLNGQRLIFFEINKGIEPLIIYLEALAFYAFGIGPVQLRLVNVFCGLLTVALVYPLARSLFNRQVAFLAMAGLAIFFWPVFVSRLTLRAVTLPPLLILALYLLWRAHRVVNYQLSIVISPFSIFRSPFSKPRSPIPQRQSPLPGLNSSLFFFALSGLVAGISMYTYLASRFVPLLVGSIFGYWFIRRQMSRVHWWGLLLHFTVWAAVFAPLANYYWQNADSFTERSGQVTTIPHVLNGEFGPMIHNSLLTLGMFTFHGDETDRYNLDSRPVFDWINGLFFYLGLGVLFVRIGKGSNKAGPAALLVLWLFWMLVPDFITDDSPHFLRTIGAMPALFILWAVGIEWLRQRLRNIRLPLSALRLTTPTLYALFIFMLLTLTTMHTVFDYFGRWASTTGTRYIYGADIAEIARYLKTNPNDDLTAISAEYYRDLDPFRFALYFQGRPPFVIWFDGHQSLAFPPPGSGLSPRYVFSAFRPPADLWQPFLEFVPAESGQDYGVYRLGAAPLPEQAWRTLFSSPENDFTPVTIHSDLVLTRYRLLDPVISGGKVQLLLAWQALRALPPGTDYTFLVRMVDRQGHVWSTADGNGYPPVNWQPGVQALQLLTLRLPGDLPPRTYRLVVEVVDRQTGRPLPADTGVSAITLTTVKATLADTPRIVDPDRLPNPMTDSSVTADRHDQPELALRGYQVSRRVLNPGDTLAVTLHWQLLAQPKQDYQVQFWLTEQDEVSVTPVYRWPTVEPVGGEWPTSNWPGDYWVQDKLDLPIDSQIPAGHFKLRGVLVDGESGQAFSPHLNGSTFPGFELGSLTIKKGR